MSRKVIAIAVALAAIAGQAAAGTGEGFKTDACHYPADTPLPGSGDLIQVPQNYPTIQEAVDAANEGDTILVYPGVYEESVLVTTPGLRIRGTDRGSVILDGRIRDPETGEYVLDDDGLPVSREIGIAVVDGRALREPIDGKADRVVIENMTARNYSRHGFFWHNVTGYWGSYLTAFNNGLYGIYAFDSRCGQLDNSYTSGNADSGFYIGECFPCDAVIHSIVAEGNALGYSGTNAGGNLLIRDSIWRDNALGIVPNSLDGEDRPPQRGLTIKNNIVENNNNRTAPGVSLAGTYFGVGIALAGGNGNVVAGNVVTDHRFAGIVLTPLPDQNLWIPGGNTIWGNVVTHDAEEYPESYDLGQGFGSGAGNCWADNTFGNSVPPMIEDIYNCGFAQTPPGGDPRVELGLIQGAAGLIGREPAPWQTWPEPTNPVAFENQPDDNGSAAYEDDGAIDHWLPALGI